MKPKSILRSFLVLASSFLLAISYTHAATLYWDGTTSTANADGGAGAWDGTDLWDTSAVAGVNATWSNGDFAIFGGTASTLVTTGAAITTSGIQFSTTGYTITADSTNTLSFTGASDIIFTTSPTAAAIISGTIGGSGSVTLSRVDPSSAATITFNGTSTTGWSGATTINSGVTTRLSGANRGLSSTSGITLNGGALQSTNNSSTQGAYDRFNDSAGIAVNGGGTFTYTNTVGVGNVYEETLGAVTLNNGQFNVGLTQDQFGGGGNVQTLNLGSLGNNVSGSGLARTTTTSAVTFSGGVLNTTSNRVANYGAGTTSGWVNADSSNSIIGSWATTGTSPTAQTDYAVYNGDYVIPANTTASAQTTWTDDAKQYTLSYAAKTAPSLSATRNIAALKASSTETTISSATVVGSPNFVINAHGFSVGDPVILGSSNILNTIDNFTYGQVYYVQSVVNANTITLAATPGGPAINAGTAQTETTITGGLKLDSSINLGTTGILNAGTAPIAIGRTAAGGQLTLPTAGAGNLFINAGSGRIGIEAPIVDNGGALTVVKTGNSNLHLSGDNTFTGGLVLNAGTLLLSGTQSFTGGITLNGGSLGDLRYQITAAGLNGNNITVNGSAEMPVVGAGPHITGNVLINSTGIFRLSNAGGTAQVDGALSGDGTLDVYAVNGSTGSSMLLTSTANTFTGRVIYSAGSNGIFNLSVNSFADSASPSEGTIVMGNGGVNSWQYFTLHTGAVAPVTFTNRPFELAGSSSNQTYRIANSSTQALTISPDLITDNATGTKTLTLGGSGAGVSTFAGLISNGGLTTFNITKTDSGIWALTNTANSYNGSTTITGTLRVPALANGGSDSSIGSSSNAATNLILNNGTLHYTGAATSTDRLFSLQWHGTINSSGSGAVNFTNTGSMGFNGGMQDKTLTLRGSNTGNNTIAAVIANNAHVTTTLTKADAGTWILSGSNTYNGLTTPSGGRLILTNPLAIQNSPLVTTGAGRVTLDHPGSTTPTFGGLSGATGNLATVIDTGYSTVTNLTLNHVHGPTPLPPAPLVYATLSYGGVISNGAPGMSLTKTGPGTQSLYGVNTYTGPTIINEGTLDVTNIGGRLHTSSAISIAAGANLSLSRFTFATQGIDFSNTITGEGNFIKAGGGSTLVMTASNAYTGSTTISSGFLQLGSATSPTSGSLSPLSSIAIGAGAYLVVNRTDTVTQGIHFSSAPLTGVGGFRKSGAGTTILNAANAYTGPTEVLAGTLRVNEGGSINQTSDIQVTAGASFSYNSSTPMSVAPTLNGTTVNNRAFLRGSGPINASMTLDNLGDVLSPGNSPGILEFTGAQSWNSLTYDWEVNDWSTDVVGTNSDQIQIDGTLDLTGSAYRLNVLSLQNNNTAGLVGAGGGGTFSEFDRAWTILTATGGITNFDATEWTVNVSGFQDVEGPGAQWSISQVGNSLVLTYLGTPAAPIVNSPTSTDITATTATLGGTVSGALMNQLGVITERGIVYSLTSANGNPLINGAGVTKVTVAGTTGVFTTPIAGLTHAANYSFKAYATNIVGTTYTAVATFQTLPLPPTVILPTSTDITDSSATLGGTVSSDGGAAITERGFVYSKTSENSAPQIGGVGVTSVTVPGTTGIFSLPIADLDYATDYSFRAYAINSAGTTYTDPLFKFNTLAVLPTVETPTSASVTSSSARLGGDVTEDGGATITERGIVFSISSANGDPLIGGPGVTKETVAGTTGVFVIPLSDFAYGTTYSFKAFATNGVGTAYTDVATFQTDPEMPTVSTPVSAPVATDPLTGVGSATLGGTVTLPGAEVIERGVVYSLATVNSNPVIGGNGVTKLSHANTAGTIGAFTIDVTDLSAFKSYRFKAYVTNARGTSYTTIGAFTPPPVTPPLTLPTVAGVGATTATLGGTVVADGGRAITERGIVYSINSVNANPLLNGTGVTKVNTTGTIGLFTKAITGLQPGKTYAFKAFAINNTGTGYTTVTTFSTDPVAPTVISPTVSTIAATKATLGGRVTADGGRDITSRGVVYSTTDSTPTIDEGATRENHAFSTTGRFRINISGLVASTQYFYRAFAINSEGTSYSAVSSFTTRLGPPVISSPTRSIVDSVVTLGGDVTGDGGSAITERGVVYSRTSVISKPRIGYPGVKKVSTGGTTGVFTVIATASHLEGGKGYSYRAYAINDKGASYTASGTFTAPVAAPLVNRPMKVMGGSTSARLGGMVVRDNGAAISACGVVYSSSNETPEIGSATRVNFNTPRTGLFDLKVTGLTPDTRYYFRAFAINSKGTSYSAVSSFTTWTGSPSLTTTAANTDLITATQATIGGNVTSDGGAAITERGVVYSITSVNGSPKIGATGIKRKIVAGTMGTYSTVITGLKPGTLYSYRAYANNGRSLTYGTIQTFRTD